MDISGFMWIYTYIHGYIQKFAKVTVTSSKIYRNFTSVQLSARQAKPAPIVTLITIDVEVKSLELFRFEDIKV